jgi:hypothetical protein
MDDGHAMVVCLIPAFLALMGALLLGDLEGKY